MLSYRHEFHAGSHADVFKHVVLCELLRYLTEKPKPLWYVDTHAGAGQYELGRRPVSGAEAATGIFRLWGVPDLPPTVQHYLGLVAAANPAGELRRYPGSPWLAAAMLRKDDRLWLSELHPADHATLLEVLGQRDRRACIEQRDGLAWLRALLPPLPRRGLVLIDPSFEVKKEYRECRGSYRRCPASIRERYLCSLVSAAATACGSRVSGCARTRCRCQLAARPVLGSTADGNRAVRQRHVRRESAVHAGRSARIGAPATRRIARSRCRRGLFRGQPAGLTDSASIWPSPGKPATIPAWRPTTCSRTAGGQSPA